MRIAGCLLVFCCLMTGCVDRDKIPSDVIPREEMGKILWDMVQADQFASGYIAKDSQQIDWKDSLRILRRDSAKRAEAAVRLSVKDSAGIAGTGGTGGTAVRLSSKDSAALRGKARASVRQDARHLSAKDSARQRVEDSFRIAQLKDSFRAGLKLKTLKLYQQVFQVHHVTLEEFRRSYQFYLERPDITKTLMDSVIARANRLRADSYSHPVDTTKKSTPPGQATRPPGQAAPGQSLPKPGQAVVPPGQARPVTTTTVPVNPAAGGNVRPSPTFFLHSKALKSRRDSLHAKFPKP